MRSVTIYLDNSYYCEYKLYHPHIFQDIIKRDRFTSNHIANSFLPSENINSVLKFIKEHTSQDHIQFITDDNKFVLRSISKREHKYILKNVLENYYQRLIDQSLLQHIYAMVKLTIKGQIYRLVILEKISDINIARSSLSFVTNCSNFEMHEQLENSRVKFVMCEEEKDRFYEVLREDIRFLETVHVKECKLAIKYCNEPQISSFRQCFKCIQKEKSFYIMLWIADLSFFKKDKRRKSYTVRGAEDLLRSVQKEIAEFID